MTYVRQNLNIIGKMTLNQFGATFMGLMVSLGLTTVDNRIIILLASTLCALFFFYLQYSVMWELGARDIIRVDGGRAPYQPLNGLKMALVANIPNIILAILIIIGHIFGSADGAYGYEWAGSMYVVAKGIAVAWEAMYNGFVQLYSPHNPIVFVLMLIPNFVAATLGYYLGLKNFRIFGLFGIRPKPQNK